MIKIFFSALLLLACCSCTPEYSNHDEPPEQQQQQQQQQQYWQTSGSKVIHNSTCFWYGKSAGGYVDYDVDGRDCKKCGGRGK